MTGTQYPSFIDGFAQLPLLVDQVSPVRANDVNRIRDAVVAVERELGINPSSVYANVKSRLDAIEALTNILAGISNSGLSLVFDFVSVALENPTEKTYLFVGNIPYDGYVYSTSSLCTTGTAKATVMINTSPLGGGFNSVSTTKDTIFHSSANGFVAGDEFKVRIENNVSAQDVSITIVFVRLVDSIVVNSTGQDGYVQSLSIPSTDKSIAIYEGLSGTQIKQSAVRIDNAGNVVNATTIAIGATAASSTLHVHGSMSVAFRTVSANATLTIADCTVLVNAASAPITITLPLASAAPGRVYYVKKIDSTSNLVSVARTSPNSIDGVSSVSTDIQYEAMTFISNGTNWYRF